MLAPAFAGGLKTPNLADPGTCKRGALRIAGERSLDLRSGIRFGEMQALTLVVLIIQPSERDTLADEALKDGFSPNQNPSYPQDSSIPHHMVLSNSQPSSETRTKP